MCDLKLDFVLWVVPQSSQTNGRSSLWVFAWSRSLYLVQNALLHSLQISVFPLCVLICVDNEFDLLYSFPQILQMYFVIWPWIFLCFRKLSMFGQILSQTSQVRSSVVRSLTCLGELNRFMCKDIWWLSEKTWPHPWQGFCGPFKWSSSCLCRRLMSRKYVLQYGQ